MNRGFHTSTCRPPRGHPGLRKYMYSENICVEKAYPFVICDMRVLVLCGQGQQITMTWNTSRDPDQKLTVVPPAALDFLIFATGELGVSPSFFFPQERVCEFIFRRLDASASLWTSGFWITVQPCHPVHRIPIVAVQETCPNANCGRYVRMQRCIHIVGTSGSTHAREN